MILVKIILDMFSARTRYIAANAAIRYKKDEFPRKFVFFEANNRDYLQASSIATATATVIPTIGLFPAPMSPIIST